MSQPAIDPNTPPAQRLAFIEHRSAHIAGKLRQAAYILLDRTPPSADASPTLRDLEAAIDEWRFLIPDDPDARTALARLLVERYQPTPQTAPRITAEFGLNGDASSPETESTDEPEAGKASDANEEEAIVEDVIPELEWRFVRRGNTLYRQGDPADSLFIVVDGLVQVVRKDEEGQETVIGEVSEGQLLGERSLVLGEGHSSTAYAIRDGDVCRLPLPALDRLLRRHPQVMVKLLTQMAQRMEAGQPRASCSARRGQVTVIAPACPETGEFAQALTADLMLYGTVLHMDAEKMQSELDKMVDGDLEQFVDAYGFVDWMQQQAKEYDHILYQVDSAHPNWTRRCVEQADRILIVGRAGATPEFSPSEVIIERMPHPELSPPRELVLLHASVDDNPGDTRAWLARRTVKRHHHVAMDTGQGVDRVSRFLRGKAIALVFGGGGMRAAACAGVARALEEYGIRADVVGGTSAGAIVAAQYALGWSVDKIIETTTGKLMQKKVWMQPTLPLVSITSAQRLNEAYTDVFGQVNMEDLWITPFTISGNLTKAQMVIHTTGLLRHAVRASTSLVGIHPPALNEEGDLLIDGGIFDNTPADVAREMVETGPVMAVDLGFTVRQRVVYDYGEYLSGWKVFWSRINPFTKKIEAPDIVGLMMRANALASINATAEQVAHADLILHPPVSDYGLYDFEAYEEIANAGYDYGKAQISAWLQAGGMNGV